VCVGYSDEQVANRDFRDFGWEIAHAAVTRRPPISLDTMVARTGGYAYDDGVWGLSLVQGPILCRAVPNLSVTIRNFCLAVGPRERAGGRGIAVLKLKGFAKIEIKSC
jgi:hypothetical protein